MLQNPQKLFDRFIQEKENLANLSPKTIKQYKESWAAFNRYNGIISEEGLKVWVVNMRTGDVSEGGANTFIRGINSFLTWLFENGKTNKHLKIKQLRTEKRVLKTYSREEVAKIIQYQPTFFWEWRVHLILCFAADTGCRIEEILTLKPNKIDFKESQVTVLGKGRKERVIPISRILAELLREYLKKHRYRYVFGTQVNTKVSYDNMRRDFMKLLDKVGVEKTEGAFHAFRRYFAQQHLKSKTNPLIVMKLLGHTSLTMTNRYTEADIEDLTNAQCEADLLGKLLAEDTNPAKPQTKKARLIKNKENQKQADELSASTRSVDPPQSGG